MVRTHGGHNPVAASCTLSTEAGMMGVPYTLTGASSCKYCSKFQLLNLSSLLGAVSVPLTPLYARKAC